MDYKSLRIEQLREICSKYNLRTDGKKNELIGRLVEKDNRLSNPLSFEPIAKLGSSTHEASVKPTEILYCQVKSANLSRYFNSGAIYPLILEESEIYKKENRKIDIFSHFPEYIILSTGYINTFENDDVLIEIVVNDLVFENIQDTELLYIGEPIPISRIGGLIFLNVTSRDLFISSTKTFPDFFFPEQLCLTGSDNLKGQTIDLNQIKLPTNSDLAKYDQVLKRFDKIMGMFSFMKNAGIFFAEKENSYQEYTPTYFSALTLINSSIQFSSTKDIGFYRFILFPLEIDLLNIQRVLFRHIIDAIQTDMTFSLPFAEKILEEALTTKFATPDEVKELKSILSAFFRLEQQQISYKDLIFSDIVRRNYPVLSLLFLVIFPNKSRQHSDKQAVRNTFIYHDAKLNKSLTEYLLGLLGLYYGYKSMIKVDTNLSFSDKVFLTIAEKQQSIKFKLVTNLDRFTIESIYRFCEKSKTVVDDYSFLMNIRLDDKISVELPNWGSFSYSDKSYVVCKTKITQIDRKNKTETIVDLIERTYGQNIDCKSLLSHNILSTFGIPKSLLIDVIRTNGSKLNFDEISQLIELDQIQKNNRL